MPGADEWNGINDGGPATQAGIYLNSEHNGLAVDSAGNLYIADEATTGFAKWMYPPESSLHFAGNGTPGHSGDGGPATSAQLLEPLGVAFDKAGNLYIADSSSVRKVDNQRNDHHRGGRYADSHPRRWRTSD